MASSSNSSTTTSSSSFTQPKKRLRLTQTSSEGVVEWTLDLHVASGAHVTCMPSGPHLLIEEVDNEEEPRRLMSSTLVRCIEDVPRNELFAYANHAPQPLPLKSEEPKSEEDESEDDKPSVDLMRAINSPQISPKDLLREAIFPQENNSNWTSHSTLAMPRVIREKLPLHSPFDAAPSTIPDSSTNSSTKNGGNTWTSSPAGWTEQSRTMLVHTSAGNIVRPVRTNNTAAVKKSWGRSAAPSRREMYGKEETKSKAPRSNNEAAPKSRVHFTADGSIPVCRMPNCRRPMYFYKNEDRWRCNLNRGGCGAVFHNVDREIGPCSKCQRPVGEKHPCHDWCVCRYCTSTKKLSDEGSSTINESETPNWSTGLDSSPSILPPSS